MKILYLYHDLMNLYGDNGNMKAMCRHLANQGFSVELERKSIGDMLDFAPYDFIYCGSGTERNQKVALKHLKQYQAGLWQAVKKGVVCLFTGNSLEMLGTHIDAADGEHYGGMGLLPFHVKEHGDKRYTGDAILHSDLFDGDVVGFINKCSDLIGLSQECALFRVKMGRGNAGNDLSEGFRIGNCFGTYLTGPVLVKNPHVLAYFISLIGKRRREDFVYTEKDLKHENNSYHITLQALTDRL